MTATRIIVTPEGEEFGEQLRRNINHICAHFDWSMADLAERLHWSANRLRERMSRPAMFRAIELADVAAVAGVEVDDVIGDIARLVRELPDTPPDLGFRRSRCIVELAA